jgi:hypothetical protein
MCEDCADLVGTAEAAEILGVEGGRIPRWRKRGVLLPNGRRVLFPKPVVELRATAVWRRADIERLRGALDIPAPPIEHL